MSYITNHDMDTDMDTDIDIINNNTENDTENEEMTTLESIYIPRIYGNIEPGLIAYTFEYLELGVVRNIETSKRPDGSDSYMAFVYFSSWNMSNPAAYNLAKRIQDPTIQARIVYDDPWYWIILPNKSEKAKKTAIVSPPPAATALFDDTAAATAELNKDEEIEILKLMVEDLQTRLLKNEKKQVEFQKELVDMRSILLTGETAKQAMTKKHKEQQLTFIENNNTNMLAPSKKTLEHHYYYDDIEAPPSPPKLVRQIATAGPIQSDEKFNPQHHHQQQQKSIRIDRMGLVYPQTDSGFWCDP
jgi:hypothetical protein